MLISSLTSGRLSSVTDNETVHPSVFYIYYTQTGTVTDVERTSTDMYRMGQKSLANFTIQLKITNC
jgi:hypothetical protein